MKQTQEQKCPACGAPLRFDAASGLLVCDYCGTKSRIEDGGAAAGKDDPRRKNDPAGNKAAGKVPAGKGLSGRETVSNASAGKDSAGKEFSDRESATKAPAGKDAGGKGTSAQGEPAAEDVLEGFDFAALSDMAEIPDAENLPVYNCVSCGAEVIAPPEQAALTCPYCGNNIVLTQKISGRLRPDGVIPFKIQAKDLPEAVNRFYKDKKLLPRGFFSDSTMGRVTGVYLPFWVFNGSLSGEMYFKGQTSASIRQGDYIVTTTGHYRLAREAALDFENIPVDASAKADDRLMDSLEPFHMEEAVPFDMRYLAGFTADRFDQKKQDIASRAKKRMQSSAASIVTARAAAGYGSVTPDGSRLGANINAKYILFPVYLFDISHAGKSYHFAVNGQTGKVVGDLPTDGAVCALYFLKRFALVSGTLIALSIAKYLGGF